MKRLKTVILVVAATAGIMAIASAGSASAGTVLCETGTGGEGCGGAPGGHNTELTESVVKASATNSSLKTNLGTVTCPTSSTTLEPEGATPKAGETTITGKASALSFGPGCKLGSTACEVIVKNLPYTEHIHGTWEGFTDRSTTTVTNLSTQVKCGSFINCTFGSPEVKLMGENGLPTTLKAEAVGLNREGGLFCPTESVWTATYGVTAPDGFTIH